MDRYCCWIGEIRAAFDSRGRAGKANRENGKQIEREEDQQLQILLPQQQDEEQFVGQNELPFRALQKKYLHSILDGNDGQDSQNRDQSAQEAALLVNGQNSRNGKQKQPGIVKAMVDGC